VKGACDGVALERGDRAAGEGEPERARPVDALGFVGREPLADHDLEAGSPVAWPASGPGGQKVRATAFVRVSRTARNQRRHPRR